MAEARAHKKTGTAMAGTAMAVPVFAGEKWILTWFAL